MFLYCAQFGKEIFMKRVLSLLLVLAMMLSNFTMLASASETDSAPAEPAAVETAEEVVVNAAAMSVPYVRPEPETVTTTDTVHVIKEIEPGVYTTVEETVTETYQLPWESVLPANDGIMTADITETGSGDYHFTTFEDLQELAKGTYKESDYTYAYYNGHEDLVIKEDLDLPEHLHLSIYGAKVIVPKGVTLNVPASSNFKTLEINGTAYFDYIHISSELSVNGILYASDSIYLQAGAKLNGYNNIAFTSQWGYITVNATINTMEELRDAIDTANRNANSRYEYSLQLQGDFVISSSIAIPENCRLQTYGADSVTINKGCTLEISQYLSIGCPFTVKGTLKTNGQISISYSEYSDNKLTFTSSGSLAGNGRLVVNDIDDIDDIDKVITGLDLDDFEQSKQHSYTDSDGVDHYYWELRYVKGLKKLSKPSSLTWNKVYDYEWDESTQTSDLVSSTFYGGLSFKPGTTSQGSYDIRIYKKGSNDTYYRMGFSYGSGENLPEYLSSPYFAASDPESGTYYFTVQNEGDYVTHYNSSIAKSGTWTYKKPSTSLGKCTDLSWDDDFELDFDEPSSGVGGYEIQFYFSPTKKGTPQETVSYATYYKNDLKLYEWITEQNGTGYYSYKVRALSSNITKRANGKWSSRSESIYYKAGPRPVYENTTDGNVKLSWAKVDGAEKYEVWRSREYDDDYTRIYRTSKLYYTDSKTSMGDAYFYKVRAVFEDGSKSAFCEPIWAPHTLPKTSVTLSAVSSSGKTKISWKKVSGAKEYKVHYSTSKNSGYELLKTTTSTSATHTGAEAGVKYYYIVVAVHKYSEFSSASDAKARTCDLARPSISLSAVSSTGRTKISWKAVPGAEKYSVYRATSKDGTYTRLYTTSKTSYTESSATAGKTYYYKVKALHEDSAANSAYSSYKYRTCDLPRPDVDVELTSKGSPKLTWDAVNGAEKYRIYRATSKSGTYTKLYTTSRLYYTDSKAAEGTTYYYKVVATHEKSAANSAYSSVVSIKAK